MKVELSRRELCDLMLACTIAEERCTIVTNKWNNLHDTLKEAIRKFDEKQKGDRV